MDTLSLNALIDDAFSNGKEINWGSGYSFRQGDTLHARLYHCTEDYYKFLSTSQTARQANVNPFAASGEVVSNVQGGLGIFATLTYSYKTAVVPWLHNCEPIHECPPKGASFQWQSGGHDLDEIVVRCLQLYS